MRHSLRRRILIGYGLAMALTALVLGWGLVNLLRLGEASEAILRENYRSILAAEKMRDAIQRQENATVFLLMRREPEVIEQLTARQQEFLLNLAKAKDNITIHGEAEILTQIEDEYNAYLYELAEFVQYRDADSAGGFDFYRERLRPHVVAIRGACDRLLELNQATMVTGSDQARSVAHTATWSMLLVGVGAIVLGIAFSWLLSARITRPVQLLMEAAERVAAGEYNTQVPCRSDDELGRLAERFNVMVAKLRSYHELRVGEIIAEKKKGEAILKTIEDGVLVVDTSRRVTSVNPAAAQALGIEPAACENAEFSQVIRHEKLVGNIEEALRSGRPPRVRDDERYLTVPLGSAELHYEFSVTPVFASPRKLLGVLVHLHNVTRLKELDRLKSEFVMTASHELRTPLTSIAMSISLLEERVADKLDSSDRELLDVAHEETERLRQLVNELLDLTKIESGKIEMQFSEITPAALLEKAVAPFRSQAAENSVQLALSVAEDLPAIRVDANKIVWVITNLLGNALRYTSPGGHIWVSAERAGRWLHVYVRDDGSGIPHEKQSMIFEKFVQIDAEAPGAGAGLGLAIAKEIVRAHRGSIWAESEPGKGALFTVALPL